MDLLSQYEKFDLATCWSILTDHGDGEPNDTTICRKGNPYVTVISNIFTENTSYYTLGPPNEYLSMYGKPEAIHHGEIDLLPWLAPYLQ
jgi:hypothetical protein